MSRLLSLNLIYHHYHNQPPFPRLCASARSSGPSERVKELLLHEPKRPLDTSRVCPPEVNLNRSEAAAASMEGQAGMQ